MRILGRWMERIRAVILLLCALLLAAAPALAREQVVLQKTATNPQTRAADAWLDQGSLTTNHGSDTTLQVQSWSNNRNQRALVLFDLSSVPSSGIKVATLSLWMSTAPAATRTYQARRVTSLWTELGASWTNRALCSTCTPAWTAAWTAGGGDNNGVTTQTATTGTTNGVFLNWSIAADVQQWYGGNTPSANYGTLIMDSAESSATQRTAIFSSKEDSTAAHRPSLTLTFIQNVQGLAATAGDSQITLTWTYPPQVPGSTIVSATNGVLILRAAGTSVTSAIAPTDGTAYSRNATCTNNVGGATNVIVFSSNTLPTTFNDSAAGDNPDCPPVDGTTYYYKVFAKDAGNYYSHNEGATNPSIYIPMTLGTPSATASLRQAASWLASTGSQTLSAPGIIPSNVVFIGAPSNIVSGIKPSDGTPMFGWVSVAGAITGRPPVLDASTSSTGVNVAYTADADANSYGFVYGINAFTGDILWMTNPTGLATNGFTAGPAVVVKKTSDALGGGYTGSHDLVVEGTRNAASTTANQVVGIDGNTGATVWTLTGGGTNPAMDIVAATPFVDYANHAIWVTSHSNAVTTQPSLWKININTAGPTATALATANLGNVSNSPAVTFTGDVLFVGNDAGTLYAIKPSDGTTLASVAGGDTKVVGSILLMTNSSPYTLVYAGATTVKAAVFNLSTKTFATTGAGTWSTTMPGGCAPSAPLGFPGLSNIYVGCSDGNLYQLDAGTGTNNGVRLLRANYTIGDPTLDVELSRIMAGCTNSRVFAFTFPF